MNDITLIICFFFCFVLWFINLSFTITPPLVIFTIKNIMGTILEKRKISVLKRKAKLKLEYILFFGSCMPKSKDRTKFIKYCDKVNEILNKITNIKIS